MTKETITPKWIIWAVNTVIWAMFFGLGIAFGNILLQIIGWPYLILALVVIFVGE